MDNQCMDWNDTIETDEQEYILLKEGDYNFRVAEFTRGRFPGSARLPPCNKATLTLEVDAPEGTAQQYRRAVPGAASAVTGEKEVKYNAARR